MAEGYCAPWTEGAVVQDINKKISKQALVVLAVVAVGAFGYVQVFTKGVDRLPERVCSGAVDRDIAVRVLPGTISATERGRKLDGAGEGSTFSCNVKTHGQDSILSGDGSIHDVSEGDWLEGVEGRADASKLEVDHRGVHAVSYASQASLYVPCTPAGRGPGEARSAYGLLVEARTIGDTAVTGDELRQEVTDFAYQILTHSYRIQGCQEGRTLPAELPRFS
ncbi:hypothetical protein [Streptomyces sp. CAI 127]|uniref:hypothetical protein n=1 Tax=Streptomyces sp. CAI 127 TaxID=1076397 RepID=UPI001587AD3C|nr:hypothetical protein [Streptomyces sp. CAI 127]NUW01384.1 hypothetical protein [Streptomyces sp. CAI 127]